jgi:micrococcal nuclease
MILLLIACVGTTEPDGDDTQDSQPDTGERDPIRDLDPSTLDAAASPCREPWLVRVRDVVDGDTAYVEDVEQSWQSEKVRFIGIDTPEIAHGSDAAECWGPEAASYTTELLEDKLVWLTFDVECEDQYDRTLAYLHRGGDQFVNVDLVAQGQAFAFPYDPNTSFETRIEAAESSARNANLGMWADCY